MAPIRVAITLSVTPGVVRRLKARGILKFLTN